MSDQNPPQYPSYPGPGEPTPPGQPPAYGTPPPAYGATPPAYGSAPAPGYNPVPIPFAGWWSRVGAYLLDSVFGFAIAIVPFIIGAVILGSTSTTTTDADGYTSVDAGNPLGYVFLVLGYLAIFGFQIWNAVFRQGRTGQTLGKKIVGIQVVRADSGAVLGAGTAFLRWLMFVIVGGICFLDYLWPLWDDKNQSWHDKIAGSVVLQK